LAASNETPLLALLEGRPRVEALPRLCGGGKRKEGEQEKTRNKTIESYTTIAGLGLREHLGPCVNADTDLGRAVQGLKEALLSVVKKSTAGVRRAHLQRR
jgi:hypothetical protein